MVHSWWCAQYVGCDPVRKTAIFSCQRFNSKLDIYMGGLPAVPSEIYPNRTGYCWQVPCNSWGLLVMACMHYPVKIVLVSRVLAYAKAFCAIRDAAKELSLRDISPKMFHFNAKKWKDYCWGQLPQKVKFRRKKVKRPNQFFDAKCLEKSQIR